MLPKVESVFQTQFLRLYGYDDWSLELKQNGTFILRGINFLKIHEDFAFDYYKIVRYEFYESGLKITLHTGWVIFLEYKFMNRSKKYVPSWEQDIKVVSNYKEFGMLYDGIALACQYMMYQNDSISIREWLNRYSKNKKDKGILTNVFSGFLAANGIYVSI